MSHHISIELIISYEYMIRIKMIGKQQKRFFPFPPPFSPPPPPSSPPSTGWTLPGQRERENLLGHFIHFIIGLLPLSLPVCWICFGFVFDGLRDLDRIRDTDPDTGAWEKIQIRIRIQI